MALAEKHRAEIQAILAKYPPEHKRSAVMPLLYLAQREYGHLDRQAITEVGALLDLEPTEVGSLIGFYTLYHDRPGPTYRLQVCTDLPCALRGAEHFTRELRRSLGVDRSEPTTDGQFVIEEVKCLAACDRVPVFQLQEPGGIHYYESQTIETALAVVEEIRGRTANG
jgi:NADH-quinone oxidoreductase subunit E